MKKEATVKEVALVKKAIGDGIVIEVNGFRGRRLITHSEGQYYIDGVPCLEETIGMLLFIHASNNMEEWSDDIAYLEEKYEVV